MRARGRRERRRERKKSGRQESLASVSKNVLQGGREEIGLISRSCPFPHLCSVGLSAGLTVRSGLCEVSGDCVSPVLHMPPGPACPGGLVSNTCPISRWQLAVRRRLWSHWSGKEREVSAYPAHRQEALPQGPRLLARCTGLPAAGRSRHSESW